jgi:hypothetical protein
MKLNVVSCGLAQKRVMKETYNLGSASGACTDCALKTVLDPKGSSSLYAPFAP